MIRCFVVLLLIAAETASAFPQQPTPPAPTPPWAVLVDPVCPVTSHSGFSFPNATKEMRVMYFPTAKAARLKDPHSLILNVGFDGPHYLNNSAVVPFTRKGDRWEVVVELGEAHSYVIFYVKDDKTNAVDDNEGRFWDVVFCDPAGQKDVNSVLRQAETYTGVGWPLSIRRQKDYAKAVSILEAATGGDRMLRSSLVLTDLWNYKAQRDGGDAQAWAKVAKEVDQFIADHSDNEAVLNSVGNFVVSYQDQLPSEFVERTTDALDAKRNDRRYSLRADAEYMRAGSERDPRQRLAALDKFIAKYPDSIQVEFAEESRLYTFAELKDLTGAEAGFRKYCDTIAQHKERNDPNQHNSYLMMAGLYIDKGVKLDAALKLIDEALETLKPYAESHSFKLPQEFQRRVEARCAEMRARAYLGLHKPELAVTEAQKALAVLKDNAEVHFLLGQAYAAAGDKRNSLNEYFEAALMPSNNDLRYRAELERFYRKNFGDTRQFQATLEKRISDRFQAANYVPKLLDQPAPTLEFTTLKGEKFDAANLSGKTVIINFWSPG